nr:hypothetical protein [Tanacetum cinerariifolium]
MTFNQRTAPKNSDSKEKVNTTKDQGIFNIGCSRHMTGNKSFLTYYQEIDGGFVAFRGSPKGGNKSFLTYYQEIDGGLVAFRGSPKGGRGPEWHFDIDSLTKSMNYEPVTAGNQTNDDVGIEINVNAWKARQEKASDHEYILLPFMPSNSPLSSSTQSSDDKDGDKVPGKVDEGVNKGSGIDDQERTDSSTQDVNTVKPSINTISININIGILNINNVGSNDPSMPSLEETSIIEDVYDDREVGVETDTNNLELSTVMMHKRFQISSMGELTFFLGLQVKQKDNGIFISQDKYVADILKKFDFTTVKTASTLMEPNKALIKDEKAKNRIFRYLKGQHKLGLWYPKDSPFDLEAFCDSDYARASLDRKSTTGEYVAAANCYRQVLWIQNQMLDYGFNFMNTKIYIDNENYLISKDVFNMVWRWP